MENKAFNIIEIYCSKSIFSIEDSLEKKWLIEKEKKLSSGISLNYINYTEVAPNTYLAKLSATVVGKWNSDDFYKNFVEYSAIVKAENFEDEPLDMLMNINVSGFMFPYLRAELTRSIIESKMPPISLQPIDFVGVYKKKKSEE